MKRAGHLLIGLIKGFRRAAISPRWMPPFVRTPMVASQAFEAPVLRRLGVNRSAEDIAAAAWQQAQGAAVHRPIGLLFKLLYWTGQLSPPWLNWPIMGRLSRE